MNDYTNKVREFFIKHKEKKFSEYDLCVKLKLEPSEVRYAISDIRYDMPVPFYKGEYIYTTKDKVILKAYAKKLEAQAKEKSIKKNIVKRYL